MQKTKYFACVYPSILFFCSKKCQIKCNTLLGHEINNKRELQNIATNTPADINYKEIEEIYRECTKEPYAKNLTQKNLTLPASDPLRFRKICFFFINMTIADQIETLDRKIKQNEAQQDLDTNAAKIPALFSNNFDKYEYLTGEDLVLKPSTVEQATFDYSSLSKFLNKGLKEEDKEEGPLKILENIEDKKKKQLKAIKSQGNIQLNANKTINAG